MPLHYINLVCHNNGVSATPGRVTVMQSLWIAAVTCLGLTLASEPLNAGYAYSIANMLGIKCSEQDVAQIDAHVASLFDDQDGDNSETQTQMLTLSCILDQMPQHLGWLDNGQYAYLDYALECANTTAMDVTWKNVAIVSLFTSLDYDICKKLLELLGLAEENAHIYAKAASSILISNPVLYARVVMSMVEAASLMLASGSLSNMYPPNDENSAIHAAFLEYADWLVTPKQVPFWALWQILLAARIDAYGADNETECEQFIWNVANAALRGSNGKPLHVPNSKFRQAVIRDILHANALGVSLESITRNPTGLENAKLLRCYELFKSHATNRSPASMSPLVLIPGLNYTFYTQLQKAILEVYGPAISYQDFLSALQVTPYYIASNLENKTKPVPYKSEVPYVISHLPSISNSCVLLIDMAHTFGSHLGINQLSAFLSLVTAYNDHWCHYARTSLCRKATLPVAVFAKSLFGLKEVSEPANVRLFYAVMACFVPNGRLSFRNVALLTVIYQVFARPLASDAPVGNTFGFLAGISRNAFRYVQIAAKALGAQAGTCSMHLAILFTMYHRKSLWRTISWIEQYSNEITLKSVNTQLDLLGSSPSLKYKRLIRVLSFRGVISMALVTSTVAAIAYPSNYTIWTNAYQMGYALSNPIVAEASSHAHDKVKSSSNRSFSQLMSAAFRGISNFKFKASLLFQRGKMPWSYNEQSCHFTPTYIASPEVYGKLESISNAVLYTEEEQYPTSKSDQQTSRFESWHDGGNGPSVVSPQTGWGDCPIIEEDIMNHDVRADREQIERENSGDSIVHTDIRSALFFDSPYDEHGHHQDSIEDFREHGMGDEKLMMSIPEPLPRYRNATARSAAVKESCDQRGDRECLTELRTETGNGADASIDLNISAAVLLSHTTLNTGTNGTFETQEERFIDFLLPAGDALAGTTILTHFTNIGITGSVVNHLKRSICNSPFVVPIYTRTEAVATVIAALLSFVIPQNDIEPSAAHEREYWYEDSVARVISPKDCQNL